MSPGDIIRKARHDRGLTQQRCADAGGVHVKAWSHWETGECLPSLRNLAVIAKAVGLWPREIVEIVEAARAPRKVES